MSLRCPDHGWGVGELGCEACDVKNNADGLERTAVYMGRMGEEMDKLNRVMTYYSFIIPVPKPSSFIGSVA